MSSIVKIGNRVAYRCPSAGSTLLGPVDPKHPPITFVQITKYLSVSTQPPGPMNFSHHPGCGFVGVDRACDDAESPVWRRIAFEASAFSVPQVSYAMSKAGSVPPQSSWSGSEHRYTSVAPVV